MTGAMGWVRHLAGDLRDFHVIEPYLVFERGHVGQKSHFARVPAP
jgi:hypothetical protein